MKDFIKWLGVNDKVAKVAVWLLIIMVFLIVTNTMLGSLGLPNYQITYDNLVKIDINRITSIIIEFLISLLNFYTIVLLVFRIKEAKKIFKYGVLYILLNVIIYKIFGYAILQVYIAVYCIAFCYLFSNKRIKYALYAIISLIFSALVQGVWYSIKGSLIDYSSLNSIAITALSIDYFIIMALIILVKEIYLKKRGEKKWETLDAGSGLVNSKKKETLPKK